MARAKKQKPDPIVQPIIREEGVQHVMEDMFDNHPELMPTLKSVGYAKLEGTNTWVSYVITTKGKDVLLIEVDEPNVRQIAEESCKTNFVNHFMDQGL